MKMPKGGMPGMGGGMPNMNNMLKQAQKMQVEMQKIQEEVEKMEFDVSVGGGAVSVKITGKKEIKEIVLKPEVVDPDDIEMLSDLLVAAVNEAIRKADEASSSAMKKATGGMGLPGMF